MIVIPNFTQPHAITWMYSMSWGFFPIVFCVLGSVSVMFSRLYLGVHSPADIVAGGIIGCVILAYWIKIDTIVDRSISFGDNGMYCCSTDSLIVHFREWMVPQFHLQFQYSVNQAYKLCEKRFILVPICPLILSFSRFPRLEATRGIASLPFPPLMECRLPFARLLWLLLYR